MVVISFIHYILLTKMCAVFNCPMMRTMYLFGASYADQQSKQGAPTKP
ncbi:hypothetical protein LINPERPRIM_LOCUS2988, partial [Linum perenne]